MDNFWENLWEKHPMLLGIVGIFCVIGWINQFIEWSESRPKWKPIAKFVKWSAIILGGIGILITCWITYSSWPVWLQRILGYIVLGGMFGYFCDILSKEYGRIVRLLMDISEKLSRIEYKLDRINLKKEVG